MSRRKKTPGRMADKGGKGGMRRDQSEPRMTLCAERGQGKVFLQMGRRGLEYVVSEDPKVIHAELDRIGIPWRQVRKNVITIVGGQDVFYAQQGFEKPEQNFWIWFQFPDTPHANACRAHVLRCCWARHNGRPPAGPCPGGRLIRLDTSESRL
jgi:hypothetical protein